MSAEDADTMEGHRAPSVHSEVSESSEHQHEPRSDTSQPLLTPEVVFNDMDMPMPDLPQPMDDTFQDLLDSDTVTNDPTLQVPEFQEEPAEENRSGEEDPTIFKEEDFDSEFLWAAMQGQTIDLVGRAEKESDSDNEDEACPPDAPRREPVDEPIMLKNISKSLIELSDGEEEPTVRAKKESPGSDSAWKDMPKNIELSDGDDGPITIKQEPEVEFLWSEMAASGVIDLSDSDAENEHATRPVLENSFLGSRTHRPKRPRADLERMKSIQKMMTARARAGPTAACASTIFNALGRGPSDFNSNAWMRYAPREIDDSTSNFAEVKRQYKAKKKAHKTTLQDEIAFKKALDKEKARIKRLEAKILQMDSSEEEAEESDDGLFVPSFTPPPSPKHANGEDGESDGYDKKRATSTNKSKSKRQKNTHKPKRTKAELRTELYYNLMAGYEEEDAKDKRRAEWEAMRAEKEAKKEGSKKRKSADANSKHKQDLLNGKKPGKKAKPKQKPRAIRNLKTSNIYEAANGNLEKLGIPLMQGKEKKKAMADLIAGIPIDESKKAQQTADKVKILKATTTLGHCTVRQDPVENEGHWNIRGMTTPLFHHQVEGAAAMKERELGEKLPLGGILADEMGFGKTIMTIADIISNPPAPTEKQRCTLIICSPAIINQWDEEIRATTKAGALGMIIRHHGHTRMSTKGASGRDAILEMEKAGVVLSTYSELLKSYPKCDVPPHLTKPVEKMAWWKKEWETKRCVLHRIQFYRVVLDEAQAIKNHRAATSIACRALMAKHRWAVSGTPIQNNLEELYPYFKFLRIPHTGSYRIFRHNFCLKGSNVYNQRLHSYLDHIMIRRCHEDELLGAAIVKLPKAHQKTKYLTFNKIERKIYQIVRKRFVKAINAVTSEGTLDDRARIVLLMCLRLRQLTSHLFMLQETMEEIFELEDIEDLWSATAPEVSADSSCTDMKKALRMMIEAKNDLPDEDFNFDNAKLNKDDPKEEPELIFKFRGLLRTLKEGHKWDDLKDRSRCHRCKLPPEEPMLTSCLHLYCSECLTSMAYEASQLNQDHTKCLECDTEYTRSSPCSGLKADTVPASSKQASTGKTSAFRKRGRPERPRRNVNDTMKWINRDGNIIPSTKTAAVQVQIETWFKQSPKPKIIVFSQFHVVMKILGKACEKKKWKYCFYNGQMSHKAREESVEQFANDPEIMIMIASLKCGGVGLNLTMASRVICIDLWFNSSVEQQAFCRVLRIGQKLETHITRFVVRNTIDERLLHIQKQKEKIIGAAMNDRTVLSQLSLEELMSLFGEVGRDANSRPFIYVEDDPEDAFGAIEEEVSESEEVDHDDMKETS